jgi:hypothetical protein
MKKEHHNPMEPADKQHYKKRYLVRKLEEQEAEKEIYLFKGQHEDSETASDSDRLDGERPVRSERG